MHFAKIPDELAASVSLPPHTREMRKVYSSDSSSDDSLEEKSSEDSEKERRAHLAKLQKQVSISTQCVVAECNLSDSALTIVHPKA